MMVVVRPWKLFSATTMLAWPAGTPLTSVPHLRATLMPLSTASAPVFIGSTMSLPHSSASAAQNGPSLSEWKARLASVTASSWACAAAVIAWVAVAEIHRRIRRQAIEVAPSFDVGDPGSLGGHRDHGQR